MVVFAHSVTLWALTTLAPATASSAPATAPAATAPTPAASTDAGVDTPDLKGTSTTSAAPARAPTPGEADPKASTNDDPRAGERLRPRWEPALFADHEVNLGRARFKLGTGLVIESADGRYSLATRLRAQLLYTMEREHEEAPAHGLQLRRARLQFKGNVFHKDFKFKTELALSPRDTGFDGAPHQTPILDWYFDLTFLRDLSVRVGQYKVPYSRQRVISSGDLQLVDRTLANGEFNLDRDIGLDLRSMDFLGMGRMRYYAGVYLGEGRDQFNLSTFELFYLARVEVLPLGLFEDYEEADFERSLKPRLSLGAAYAFVDGAARNRGILGATPSDGGTTDYHNVTVDAVFMVAGFSLFTEFYYRKGQR
ncbi:MAG: hypothetical protein KC636_30435, partial [Myxococcales bacterium]|nr:hypothetical protein [Myxococcales bacterium]